MRRSRLVATCLMWLAFAISLVAGRPLFTSNIDRIAISPSFGLTTTRRLNSQYTVTIVSLTDIRGGNVQPSKTTTMTTTTPSSSSSTLHNIRERVGPYWSSFSKLVQEKTKLVQEKVEPALKDPKSNIWDPLLNFVDKQKQVAQERQTIVKEDPKQAAFLVFKPSRFFKIGIAAWIVAEVLHTLGFFDNPEGVVPRLQELYKEHAEGTVQGIQYRIMDWYEDERMQGGWLNINTYRNLSLLLGRIRNMAPRYQFAIGGGLGMLVSPVVWSLAVPLTKFFLVTYFISEVNEYWKDASSVGESMIEFLGFRGKGGDRINDLLDNVREAVRSTVLYPDKFWADTKEFMTEDDSDGLSAGTKQGIVLGTIIGVIV